MSKILIFYTESCVSIIDGKDSLNADDRKH